jgi:hypothetical protein
MPTNVAAGSASAIGSRFPPSPQPTSSSRQLAGGAGSRPNSVPSVASVSGCVWAKAPPGYGMTSYNEAASGGRIPARH